MTLANRLAYGETLIELAGEDPHIVVLDADVSGSTGIRQVKEAFPDRFITVGIAEQNMMGIAAGMASCGKIAFATTFGVFASMRAVEQVRNAICYTNLNVKIAGTHAGIETGPDGATHQAIEDMAIIRSIPNIKLLVPSTPNATRKLTRVAAATDGPVYLRFGKNPSEEFYTKDEEYPLGGSKQLRDGDAATIIACGSMLAVALKAADELIKRKTRVRVIDMYSVKPIDESAIIRSAMETGGIVTIEDHNVIGGLGGAVSEITATHYPTRVIRIGLQDVFGHSGDFAGLRVLYGLTPEKLIEAVDNLIADSL
jgi:transketolase